MRITIDATWHTRHVIDSADFPDVDPERVDWQNIEEWPEEALEQVTTAGASLADWDISTEDSPAWSVDDETGEPF